jgi:hypothetical protein
MNPTEITKKEDIHSSWEDTPSQKEQLAAWQESAFQAALEKLRTGHGNPDSVMRMGEAFGRGLFAQRIKEQSPDWTMKQWLQLIEKDVCEPLGTEFTFTKISPDVATTFLNRNPLAQKSTEHTAASLFNFGVMRGLFLSAFPQGELVISELKNNEQPEFIFKANASAKDKLERERIIRTFTFLKEEDGA